MMKIDRYDVAILEALQRDGRMTKQRLSHMVGLSPTPCYERIKRLEQNKLITSYRATVDAQRLTRVSTFFVTIVLASHQTAHMQQFEKVVSEHPQIVECHALGGGLDYLLKIVEQDIVKFQQLTEILLELNIGIAQYSTYMVTKTIFGPRELPLKYLWKLDNS